ncbi:MAG TPA: cysteine dioxygenase family protein [Blastocatellia bacterium]|nr:cysteine dioxygenase family protein [Blastocatellia bacterium]
MVASISRLADPANQDCGVQNNAAGASVAEYPIERFAAGLRFFPETAFSGTGQILKFMVEHPIDPATLEPYLLWDQQHYTRNLIDRTPLYELVAICWDVGQMSSIHNHQDQNCWMAVPIGRLMVQNYHVMHQDLEAGKCRIERAGAEEMNPRKPQAVNPEAPVHRVLNPREFNARAVSVHVYSRPIDNCVVYSEENQSCGVIGLSYTSVRGIRQPRERS